MDDSGATLSQEYYRQVVAPLLAARWPGLRYAAGRLGSGSDVLGFDDGVSRDHDWGLRLTLLVPADLVTAIDAYLDTVLPESFSGHPTRFPLTADPQVRHRVSVADVDSFVHARTGIHVRDTLSTADWLTLTGQSVLEVTAGPVFVDTAGELTAVRERMQWYPHDVWIYAMTTDWARIAQELPFIGRTAERGDDVGSRVIAARLAGAAMHLGHLLERRWPPYSKWVGVSLDRLPRARSAIAPLRESLGAADWPTREGALVKALRVLHRLQRDIGLPGVDDPVEPFWDRPYHGVRDDVLDLLEEAVTDPAVRALPRGVGTAEQCSDNVDILVHASRRQALPPSDPCG